MFIKVSMKDVRKDSLLYVVVLFSINLNKVIVGGLGLNVEVVWRLTFLSMKHSRFMTSMNIFVAVRKMLAFK